MFKTRSHLCAALLLAAATAATATAAQAQDKWLAKDKLLHVGAGWAVAEATLLATGTSLDRAAVAGCAAGLAKEAYDARTPGHVASAKDLLATCAGAWLGPRFRGFLGGWLIAPKEGGGTELTYSAALK